MCVCVCAFVCTCVCISIEMLVTCSPGPSAQTDIVRSADGISSVITFQPNGPRTIDVEFDITNDDVALEAVETYTVRLSPPSGVILGAIPTTNVEVTDDDG